jgi:spore germination protein YaaH
MSQHRLLLLTSALVVIVEVATFNLTSASAASIAAARGIEHTYARTAPAVARAPEAGAIPTRPLSQGSTRLGSHEVFGFGLASSLGDPTVGYPSWNFSLLSTVAFFGLHINWDGTLVADYGWNVWNSSTFTSMLSTAHSNGTKVVVTIVLQDFQAGTPNMCAGLINRTTTVLQAVAQVRAKGVDGLNVDYEGLNGTCQNGQTAQSMMTDFARQLRAALPSGSYLSVDTYASSAVDTLGFFDVAGLNAYVDSFFVMAYDLEYSNYLRAPASCSSFCLGPTAPLSGYYYNDTSTASQYIAAVPASKVILGVPYYGRKACVGGAVPNAYPNSSVIADSYLNASGESSASGVQAGSYAAHRDANDPAGQVRWDTWYNSSLGCTRELYWDDATALGAKYDLVINDGLRGVGIWNLNYGGSAPELWSALAAHFGGCTGASLSPGSASQPAGSTVSLTASSTGCAGARYAFWLQPPGGTWSLMQNFGGPSLSWNTAGLTPGAYNVHVWVNTQGNGYDAIGASTITLTGCTSASVTPLNPSLGVGTVVTLTAGSGGCPSPVYEFWAQFPGGSWYLVRGFGGPTATWNTAGLAPGNYTIHAWANQQGAAPSLEAYGSSVITLTCASAALNPPSSSPPAGSTVSFTASSAGCPNLRYAFWVQNPGGAWTFAQDFGGPTFTWNTAGIAPGTYTVHVWANHSGNGYEAIGSATLSLTGCASASLSPSNPSQPAASTVTFLAGSAGCPNPTYMYWVQYPNGSWYVLRGFGGPSFSWSTAGLGPGTYTVHAWANQQGAAPTVEAFGSSSVTLVPTCTSAALTPSSGSSAVGTVGTFTAVSTGCTAPVYEFWLMDPSGAWHVVQLFGTTAKWTWNTSGWPKGTYTLHVWADQQGAGASVHEAIGSATYTLT